MTLEEIQAQLEALGIQQDSWRESPGGVRKSPLVEKQKEALLQVKALLEHQLEQDQNRVAELYEQVDRIKHGGGS